MLPYSHDQPDNAARLERLGVSRTILRHHYQRDRIVKELQKLLKPGYAAQAAESAQMVQIEAGVQRASNAIEKQLEAVGSDLIEA